MLNIINWKPTATITSLVKRAKLISKIRLFFQKKGLLEVETPMLSHYTVTDINLFSFNTVLKKPHLKNKLNLYLITSPEYHMKRLLAANGLDIFQICRCFRDEEISKMHNPEFTMLEWYRINFNMFEIMDEVNLLLQQILIYDGIEMFTYQKLFKEYIGIDPLSADKILLAKTAINFKLINKNNLLYYNYNDLLQLLFTILVEPNIGIKKPTFVYYFPASQATLAKLYDKDNRVACRFEVFFKGVELVNGCNELINVKEHYNRFYQDNYNRIKLKLPIIPIDENLLNALSLGTFPECSGVALGIDRLIMLKLKKNNINKVIAFPTEKA